MSHIKWRSQVQSRFFAVDFMHICKVGEAFGCTVHHVEISGCLVLCKCESFISDDQVFSRVTVPSLLFQLASLRRGS